jgi:hypothetical protein
LSAQDVRGLSKRAVSEQEMLDRYRAKALAEALASVFRSADPADLPTLTASVKAAAAAHDVQADIPDDVEDKGKGDAKNIDNIAPYAQAARLLAEKSVTGKGHRKISWIWVSSLQLEDVNDPQLTDGKSQLPVSCMILTAVMKGFVWNGQELVHDEIAGWRRSSLIQRRCAAISSIARTSGSSGSTLPVLLTIRGGAEEATQWRTTQHRPRSWLSTLPSTKAAARMHSSEPGTRSSSLQILSPSGG